MSQLTEQATAEQPSAPQPPTPPEPSTLPPPQPTRVGVTIPIEQPLVLYGIIASLIIIFFIQLAMRQTATITNPYPLEEWGSLSYENILYQGEYYRLFTALFLHLTPAHFFFNALALWMVGQTINRMFGNARFLAIYLIGGVFGNLLEFYITRGIALGASGSVFGVFGAELVLLYVNRERFAERGKQELRSLLFWLGLNVLLNVYALIDPQTIRLGVFAHLGGFIGGSALAWFIAPRYAIVDDPTTEAGKRVIDAVKPQTVWLYIGLFAFGLVLLFAGMLAILPR